MNKHKKHKKIKKNLFTNKQSNLNSFLRPNSYNFLTKCPKNPLAFYVLTAQKMERFESLRIFHDKKTKISIYPFFF